MQKETSACCPKIKSIPITVHTYTHRTHNLSEYAKEFMRNDFLNYQYANAVCIYVMLNRV